MSQHDSQTVDEVHNVDVTGANIMVGVFPDGSERLYVCPAELPAGDWHPDITRAAATEFNNDRLPNDVTITGYNQ